MGYSRRRCRNPRKKRTNFRENHELKEAEYMKPINVFNYINEDQKKLIHLFRCGIPIEEKNINGVRCELVIEEKKLVFDLSYNRLTTNETLKINKAGYTHKHFMMNTPNEILLFTHLLPPTTQQLHAKWKALGALTTEKFRKKYLNFRYRRVINDDVTVDFYICDERKLCIDIGTGSYDRERADLIQGLGFTYRHFKPHQWKEVLYLARRKF